MIFESSQLFFDWIKSEDSMTRELLEPLTFVGGGQKRPGTAQPCGSKARSAGEYQLVPGIKIGFGSGKFDCHPSVPGFIVAGKWEVRR